MYSNILGYSAIQWVEFFLFLVYLALVDPYSSYCTHKRPNCNRNCVCSTKYFTQPNKFYTGGACDLFLVWVSVNFARRWSKHREGLLSMGLYVYCDERRDILWNIAWARGKSWGQSPRDFPRSQALFHSISRLASQYRHSHSPNNGFAAAVAYAAVPTVAAKENHALPVKLIASVEEVLAAMVTLSHSNSSSQSQSH